MRPITCLCLLLLFPAVALGQIESFRKEVKQAVGSVMTKADARAAVAAKDF